MTSKQSTVDFLLEQITGAGRVRARKMFGEYALYCDEKVVALVCDDILFVKPTIPGREFLQSPIESPPYPGAKNYFLVSEDFWEDKEWLTDLFHITAQALPAKKK